MSASIPKKVVLGMSGGVDSSVAAKLLKDQGYEVLGVTLKVWEEEDETTTSKRWQERGCCKVGIAKHVAELLDISHQVIDTRESFQQGVIDDFIEVSKGLLTTLLRVIYRAPHPIPVSDVTNG
jgi:tRNA-specific 2-thiouridylase